MKSKLWVLQFQEYYVQLLLVSVQLMAHFTPQAPLSSTNFLYEIDRITQDVVMVSTFSLYAV
jgi:hypothetical protein